MTIRVNRSVNPTAITAGGGFTSTNGVIWNRIFVTSGVPTHPRGLTTAVKGNMISGQTSTSAVSLTNIDGLSTTGATRMLGAWVLSAQAGYEVKAGGGFVVTPLTANVWRFVKATTSVAGGAQATIVVGKTTGNAVSTDFIWITGVVAENGTVAVGEYFDGGDPMGAWNGTVNLSASTLYVPSVVLTQYNNYLPVPRCEALITDCPPSTTLTLRRTADERVFDVRGGINRSTAGGVPVLDSEIPFGVLASYQAEIFSSTGVSLGFSQVATTTMNQTTVCLHQPMDPTLGSAIGILNSSFTSLRRGFSGETVYTGGATVGRWVGGRRHGLSGVGFRIQSDTAVNADMIQSMFGTYLTDQVPVLCLRTPPTFGRVPRTLFLAIPDMAEIDLNTRYGGTVVVFECMGDEVAPPAPGLIVPLLGYDDTDLFYGTYSALDTAYGTYLARDRDYAKGGYAP